MNGKKSKKIRKMIYGDYSHRQRKYIEDQKGTYGMIIKKQKN